MALAQKTPTQADLARQYIEQCRADPIWFAQNVLNHRVRKGEASLADLQTNPRLISWELDDFQYDILNAVADVWRPKTIINHDRKNQITVVSGHGPGKTHTAGLVAHYFNACWPGRIVVTAPKFDQVKT